MLEFARSNLSERKLRLFALAYSRRIWNELGTETRRLIDVEERYLDGHATPEELATAVHNPEMDRSPRVWDRYERPPEPFHLPSLDFVVSRAVRSAVESARAALREEASLIKLTPEVWDALHQSAKKVVAQAAAKAETAERASLASILRCVAGPLPFGPVKLGPTSLTTTVTSLAQAIYDDRQLPSGLFDNVRLSVLADALEEAGCDNADILDHCRHPGEHVRGCWVIDQILGRM
jgi:hypothetical protein